ncbi:MAG: ABC transporter permease [Treponema sp.]|jgi:peptide/nickel transport system permease protein|nr:ABC transporter permease [Treponema sp.]
MATYLVRRICACVPVLLLVSVFVFGIGCLVPGDLPALILGPEAAAEDILALRERMGLDRGIGERYVAWLAGLLRLDLGDSFANGLPVTRVLAGRMGPTFSLALFSLLLSVLIAVPLGTVAALRRGRLADLVCSVIALAGVSVPGFLLGLFLILVFAVKLRWFPVALYVPPQAGLAAHLHSIALPGIALALMYAALLARIIRSSLAGALEGDYVRAARSKGADEWVLALRHALPNILPPVLSVLGQGFIGALTGAAALESLFGIPGMGALAASSIGRRDLPVIQALVLLFVLVNQGLNLLIDLLCALLDPRIRLLPDSGPEKLPEKLYETKAG